MASPYKRMMNAGTGHVVISGPSARHVDVRTITAIVLIHAVAITAPLRFSWLGLALFVVLSYVTLVFGLIIGYHRLFTHRSFETSPAVSCALAIAGTLALEGSPLRWAATHRLHHRSADTPTDPHSPRHGLAWAHIIWSMFFSDELLSEDRVRTWTRDLYSNRWLLWINNHFLAINVIFAMACLAFAYISGGTVGMASVLAWGFCLRICVVWHTSWLINSFCHHRGYRNFETNDDSVNNWLVALLTFGEGWHNNHHARPSRANFGVRMWEIDFSFLHIALMEQLGLVWKVKR
jgi:fatty-acid desaturase